uniref:Uncharacterized protein n=1 Tax=Zea mays TaxID=4577 RepID=B8A233_MAIZE|nr:unknown [Zea mays]
MQSETLELGRLQAAGSAMSRSKRSPSDCTWLRPVCVCWMM